MLMSYCHQSKGLWNDPMIGQHIGNAEASSRTDKNTQILIVENNKDSKQRFKGISQETSG